MSVHVIVEVVPALVERIQAAGLPVHLAIDGSPASLPATVDMSTYRIAQEALTNTLKPRRARAGAANIQTSNIQTSQLRQAVPGSRAVVVQQSSRELRRRPYDHADVRMSCTVQASLAGLRP